VGGVKLKSVAIVDWRINKKEIDVIFEAKSCWEKTPQYYKMGVQFTNPCSLDQ
jgi:hypothetical protein